MKVSELKPLEKNPFKSVGDEQIKKIAKSIQEFERMMEIRRIVIDEENNILGGNKRYFALKKLGYKEIPDAWIEKVEGLSEEQKKEFIVKDNAHWGSEWDVDMLKEWDVDFDAWGVVDISEWGVEDGENEGKKNNKKLSDKFIIPPFSVLDTKQGAWQQRKNYWLSLGIKSEIGRDAKAYTNNNVKLSDGTNFSNMNTDGTSIFDPVLCELAYQWFNVPKGTILDPFAGGSVRGIVAAKLGFSYLGNDLRLEQIEANRTNASEVLQEGTVYPTWTCGDSLDIDKIANGYEADMIFSCPPYADLEVYSDDERDLSNMSYDDFIKIYREIIRKSCDKLKEDRFAVFVVGDVRGKNGFYQNFVSDTIKAFHDCGVLLYNEMILVNQLGNLPMRAAKYMNGSRKVGKQHQNVLVFYKGNPKNIKVNYPKLDLAYIEEQNDN
jgi:DNA modification methylase